MNEQLIEVKNGDLLCKLCGDILAEKTIAPEDENGLPAEISVHFSMKHGRDVNAEFDLSGS